jgi:anti-sigma regulatory factor (Ser/Thr protein kinase)
VSPVQSFPPDTATVRDVRRFVAECIEGLPEEQVEVILLAASELAANSVRHAGTAYTVRVDRSDTEVRVTVEDGGNGTPEVQDPGPLTPSGRGLMIVEQLSDAWGTSRAGDRNRVWFAVRSSSPSSSSSGAGHAQGPRSGRSWRARPGRRAVGRCGRGPAPGHFDGPPVMRGRPASASSL